MNVTSSSGKAGFLHNLVVPSFRNIIKEPTIVDESMHRPFWFAFSKSQESCIIRYFSKFIIGTLNTYNFWISIKRDLDNSQWWLGNIVLSLNSLNFD